MAKITTITNPLTGQPAQVDQLDHTAQQIDDGIGRALPGGAIDLALSTKTNPNLLDNWYFGNPVNQRGQTEYTVGGYTVDRWIVNAHQITISNGIALPADDFYFQKIEQSTMDALSGKQITFSVLTTSNVFLTGSWVVDNTVQSDTKIAENNEFALYRSPWTGSGWGIATKTATHILAAKLELGTQQTLAHKDANGNWVLNEIPDYGEQLRRCQWYFRRIKLGLYGSFGEGYTFATTDGYCYITVPYEEMRTIPAVSISSYADFGIAFGGNTVTPTAFATENNFVGKTSAHLSFAIQSGSGVSKPCSLIDNTGNAYIDLIT